MRIHVIIILTITALVSFASPKEKLDTIYYDSNWKGCSKTFATFYRVMSIPTESNPRKQLRDYFITGELQGESNYISVDRLDDSNSIFDGDVQSYYKSGKIHQQTKWENSHRVGEAFEYYENGKVKQHNSFNSKGEIDGEYCLFNEDGNLTTLIEFHDGIPNTYFTAYNNMGAMGHYDLQTQSLVTEPVSISDLKTKIVKGNKYYYYDDKNGIYLSIMVDAVKHYGKYYRVGVSIFNNTNQSIVFDPSQITAAGRFFKKKKSKDNDNLDYIYMSTNDQECAYDPATVKTKDIRVWSFADYTKKVHRRQQWDKALVALGQGMAAANAGYSTSYSTSTTYGSAYGYGNGYASAYGSATTYTTTTYYDATAAAIAQERAANNVATYSASLESDTEAINENYLQLTTLDPQTEIGGYFLLNKDKPQIIDLTIPINGIAYQFHLTEIPK